MQRLDCPQGRFFLQRLPLRRRETLRAWDAADEYLLNHVAEEGLPAAARLLILNDGFGALTVALHQYQPVSWSDSWLAHEATRCNLAANGLAADTVTCLPSTEQPQGPFDWVLIKLPKNLGFLEHQLRSLRPRLHANSRVIAAGMVKHMPPAAIDCFAANLGETHTSLAVKKARLIFCRPDLERQVPPSPFPKTWPLEGTPYTLVNQANVFSRDSLDIGTRVLLPHVPAVAGAREIIDLGCGNGALGLVAAERNPQARITFVDESYMAVASAEASFRGAFGEGRAARFIANDALSGFEAASADLILCNPPFHQGHAVGDHIAWRMFRQSQRVLRSGGELWIVGNRHLGYHAKLKRLFGHCELVASDRKFVVLRAVKEGSPQRHKAHKV